MNTEDKYPKQLTFEEYLKQLTRNINGYLNQDSNQQVGFACFIFDVKKGQSQASLISNCETALFYPLIKRFIMRLGRNSRKRLRKEKIN